jgi:hemolysin activation/secretion protein
MKPRVFISAFVLAVQFLAATLAAAPAFAQPAPARDSRPGEPDEAFDILEYQVIGNSVLPPLTIERAVYPHLGEHRRFQDVENARAALEQAYRDAGYATVLVSIPEQQVVGGVVRLEVVEGKVERVRVTGAKYYSLGEIRARVPSLAPGTVPYFPDVQRELASLSRTEDRQVQPVLRPGKGPGTVEVEIAVKDELPLHGSLDFNNNASPNTTDLRVAAQLRYDNLWQKEHSISLGYAFAPERNEESRIWSLNYLIPFSRSGRYLALYGVRSRSDIAAVGDVTVIGSGNIYGTRYIVPLPAHAEEGFFHSLTFGVDYKDFFDQTGLQGSDSFETPITYVPFLFQYGAGGHGDKRSTHATAGLTFNIRGVAGAHDVDFEQKRYKASASFFYLRAGVRHSQRFFGEWRVNANADAQFAREPLISNEQFAIGGADSVRGYLLGEQFGDWGARGSLELGTPTLAPASWSSVVSDFYAFAFYDAGHVAIYDPLPEQQSRFTLTSTGLGLRFGAKRHLTAALDWAWPLKDSTFTKKGDARLLFRVVGEF